MIKHTSEIVAMDNSKNQGLRWIEKFLRHPATESPTLHTPKRLMLSGKLGKNGLSIEFRIEQNKNKIKLP
jgi:hypothetical protein